MGGHVEPPAVEVEADRRRRLAPEPLLGVDRETRRCSTDVFGWRPLCWIFGHQRHQLLAQPGQHLAHVGRQLLRLVFVEQGVVGALRIAQRLGLLTLQLDHPSPAAGGTRGNRPSAGLPATPAGPERPSGPIPRPASAAASPACRAAASAGGRPRPRRSRDRRPARLAASSSSCSPNFGSTHRWWIRPARSVDCSARYSAPAGGICVRSSQPSSRSIEVDGGRAAGVPANIFIESRGFAGHSGTSWPHSLTPKNRCRKRHSHDWGLVHFSARRRILRKNRWPKTWTCPLPAARGGQSHFRGDHACLHGNVAGAAKIGTVPSQESLPQALLIASRDSARFPGPCCSARRIRCLSSPAGPCERRRPGWCRKNPRRGRRACRAQPKNPSQGIPRARQSSHPATDLRISVFGEAVMTRP